VLRGNKAIEIRKAGVNKGAAVQQWMAKKDFDFILAIGDDLTDEDMFAVLPQTAYSFHVGDAQTEARFRLRNPAEVLQFLAGLAVDPDCNAKDSQETTIVKPTSGIHQI
jgi:trehalose 6-phosphate synthase/phosphatase